MSTMNTSTEQLKEDISRSLAAYLNWFKSVLHARTGAYFGEESDSITSNPVLTPPPQPSFPVPLDQLVTEFKLSDAEVLVLILTLVPYIQPQLLDIFFTRNSILDRGFTEFGGVKGEIHGGFLPTAETAVFLLAGDNLDLRIKYLHVFRGDGALFKYQVLNRPVTVKDEPELGYPLTLTQEYMNRILSGEGFIPDLSPTFPARRITTSMDWSDLVVHQQVMENLNEIRSWVEHGKSIMEDWELKRVLKPGFRSLFYGPPGTGKTFAATLIGKATERDVYRIDLSMIVSKYIGETEKNLANVFDQAEHKEWILFFDEADALFGKRTVTSSSNDRHANQEVSYLLQRIEDYPGVILLATNFKTNIDDAFMRRFQSVVEFMAPNRGQRVQLWRQSFGEKVPVDPALDFEKLGDKYEITGGEIVNVVRHAALKAFQRPDQLILMGDLLSGIRREFLKDGRIFDPLR